MGKRQPASTKTAVRPCRVAACQRVNMTTCERALQSGEALEAQLQEGTPEADVLSLSSCCPLLVRFSGSLRDKSWPQCQAALASPPLLPSLQSFWSCPSSSCLSLVLSSSSSPLVLLLACSPHVVLLALSGHSLSFFCPLGVFVLFSFPHPFVLLMSCCCRAVYVVWAGAAAAHDNNNSCQLSCLGSMLV